MTDLGKVTSMGGQRGDEGYLRFPHRALWVDHGWHGASRTMLTTPCRRLGRHNEEIKMRLVDGAVFGG